MIDKNVIHKLARAIMENRIMMNDSLCLVQDWDREEKDNPHVAQALAQARACIAVVIENQ